MKFIRIIFLLLAVAFSGFASAARQMENLDRGVVAVDKGGSEVVLFDGIRGRQVMQPIKKMMPNLQNEPGGNFSIARLKARPLLFRKPLSRLTAPPY